MDSESRGMGKSHRLLFVSHSASRNGASILLLSLLRWLRDNTRYELEVLCCGTGPLIKEFQAVAPTRVLRGHRVIQRLLASSSSSRLSPRLYSLLVGGTVLGRRFDLVYANTAAAWPQINALRHTNTPVLWHIHELPYALEMILGNSARQILSASKSRFVAVSQAVANALIRDYDVDGSRVDLVLGFVAGSGIDNTTRLDRRVKLLASIGWPADAFVVGGCGSPGWRKGSDLFLQIARVCRDVHRDRPMRFLWVGGDAGDVETRQFHHDVRKLGLEAVCRHVETIADVDEVYGVMDAFALTSREDPFPLRSGVCAPRKLAGRRHCPIRC